MGDYDIYCAFCAGPSFSIEYDVQNIEGDGWPCDPCLKEKKRVGWLENIMCIGMNEIKHGCFLSGRATSEHYGIIKAKPGDDPNFPKAEEYISMHPDNNKTHEFHAYVPGRLRTVFPFHDACLEVFQQVISHQSGQPSQLDKDALYKTFASLNQQYYQAALHVDYYELQETRSAQFFPLWNCNPAWVMDPLQVCDDLEAYCTSMPSVNPSGYTGPVVPQAGPSSDPFSKLPEELILFIITFLPMKGVTSFRLASRAAAATCLTNLFWRDLMFIEMPWLCDVFPRIEKVINNRQLFKFMREVSNGPKSEHIKGLANRRRIWNTCLQILSVYVTNLPKFE